MVTVDFPQPSNSPPPLAALTMFETLTKPKISNALCARLSGGNFDIVLTNVLAYIVYECYVHTYLLVVVSILPRIQLRLAYYQIFFGELQQVVVGDFSLLVLFWR